MTEAVQLNKEVNPRFEEFLFDWNQVSIPCWWLW